MALKAVVSKRVLDDILGPLYKEGSWKVLVLDGLSTRIISACCKMHEVMSKGITIVEALDKKRQPFAALDAIYIMVPSDESISHLIGDFNKQSLYRAAHVFFIAKCSASLFSKLGASSAAKKIVTLQEANMAFLPYESNVFTLDYPQAFDRFYSAASHGKAELVEKVADQLATVCAMLGEFPAIRYRDEIGKTQEIADAIQTKLEAYKAEKRDLGQGAKQNSELIILDRGFDVVSPILHELTFQAMVYDLLPVKNDVYRFYSTSAGGDRKEREVILDENDTLWSELRHKHIADVSKQVNELFQEFTTKKKLKGTDKDASIKDMSRMLKKMPQYQKELSQYALHVTLASDCMQKFRGGVNNLCTVEQDIALGTNPQGERIADPLKAIMPSLFDRQIQPADKVRILMLYLLLKGGVSRADFIKLMEHAEIHGDDRKVILNMMHFGVTVITEAKKSIKHTLKRKVRTEERYEVSRWVPVVQDIIEYAAASGLDQSYCPYLRPGGKSRMSSAGGAAASWSSGGSSSGATGGASSGPSSVRQRWNWVPSSQPQKSDSKEAAAQKVKKDVPTIIIFIIGGMTYSEMRAIYEVSNACTTHEFIIGSTHIITPKEFTNQLGLLNTLTDL